MTRMILPRGPVPLRFDEDRVLIHPEDHRRFMRAAKRAARILLRGQQIDEAVQRFNDEYLPRLYKWCLDHRDKVQACYLGTPTPSGIDVFMVGTTDRYDFALGTAISHFALQLEREGWPSNIRQIPQGDADELLTFFKPEDCFEIYAQARPASGEGGS